jgi:hypothetical protein
MLGTPTPTSIAISIAIGTSLLGGLLSIWIAMRSPKPTANRDTTVSILFSIAVLLTLLNATAGTVVAIGGLAYLYLLQTTLLLTAAFAILSIALGATRSLRTAGRHS